MRRRSSHRDGQTSHNQFFTFLGMLPPSPSIHDRCENLWTTRTPQPMAAAGNHLALIVDDREEVAATLAEMCRAFGFAAEIAQQGVGMLALLQRHRPCCVIVDVLMPHQDGYEALKEIAGFDPKLPVMLV